MKNDLAGLFFSSVVILYMALGTCLGFINFAPLQRQSQQLSTASQLFFGLGDEETYLNCTTGLNDDSLSSLLRYQSRREWLQAALITTLVCTSSQKASAQELNPTTGTKGTPISTPHNSETTKKSQPQPQPQKTGAAKKPTAENTAKKPTTEKSTTTSTLSPSDIEKIISENTINVTKAVSTNKVPLLKNQQTKTLLTIDKKNYDIIQTQDVPSWVPAAVRRPPRVIKSIPNSELLLSGIVAGSITEIIRTSLLYPLLTVTSRIQADRGQRNFESISQKFNEIFMSFWWQARQGDLYAGIIPTLLVTVPASGVYFGIRDVTKRMLKAALQTPSPYDDIAVALGAAFVADVVSLTIRTPADVLAKRLQVQGSESNAGNWLKESFERLPAIIVTDLPFIFFKIALNYAVVTNGSSEGLGRYEIQTILITCVCAALTTPFDVARTRIVMQRAEYSKPDANITELAPVQGVLKTMENVAKEGDGGIPNLFAGWIERTLYLGIGRAWLDPIRVIGYLGIRDAVLLEWFN